MICKQCDKEVHPFITDKGVSIAVDNVPIRIMNNGHLFYGFQMHSDTCPEGYFLSEEHDVDTSFDKKVQPEWTMAIMQPPKGVL